jgi:ABC-type transport system substrate-binding protein
MKITKTLLRKIIKEELLKEYSPQSGGQAADQGVEDMIQDLLAQAKKESDPKKREELAKKAQKLIADEFYYQQRGMEY